MWIHHPIISKYQANAETGEIKSTKGICQLVCGKLSYRQHGALLTISGAKFVYECFHGEIEQQFLIDLDDEQKGFKLSNLVKVTKVEKIQRDIDKKQAIRERMETTCEWKTHPYFDDYLGSVNGDVYSMFSNSVIKGQKREPYGFIAMNLTTANGCVYITQHQFIYECFNGLIDDRCELSHCNLIEDDNALSNLKLLTHEEETKIFDDSQWYQHPKYSLYMADTSGNVYKRQTRQQLKYKPNQAGYIELKLLHDDKTISVPAHRFVFECFHGLVGAAIEIDHRNTIRSQNDIRNLTALGKRAHNKKTRKDNPDMSSKRAATCSQPVLRIKVDQNGTVIESTRFDSPKLAVVACGPSFKTRGITDAIRDKNVYKNYRWEYEAPADLPGEIWKTLKYEGRSFTVSSCGRVKTSYGVSNGYDNGHGYLRIGFGNDIYPVHHLVCLAFHGPPPADMKDPTVDHIDRGRSNNKDTNLRWADRATQGLNRVATKKVLGFLKTDPSVTFGPFDSIKLAAKEMSVDQSSISAVCKGKRKSAGSHNKIQLGWKEITIDNVE